MINIMLPNQEKCVPNCHFFLYFFRSKSTLVIVVVERIKFAATIIRMMILGTAKVKFVRITVLYAQPPRTFFYHKNSTNYIIIKSTNSLQSKSNL